MSWRPHDRLGLHHGRNLVELMRNLCCWGGSGEERVGTFSAATKRHLSKEKLKKSRPSRNESKILNI